MTSKFTFIKKILIDLRKRYMPLINITYNISDVKREPKTILLSHKALGYSIRHISAIKNISHL